MSETSPHPTSAHLSDEVVRERIEQLRREAEALQADLNWRHTLIKVYVPRSLLQRVAVVLKPPGLIAGVLNDADRTQLARLVSSALANE